MENRKLGWAWDVEALRLLRAFFKISDPKRRREVIMQVEKLASDTPLGSEPSLPQDNKAPTD
jgi:hypothetical protein